ncbi:TatD family hydrolase [Olivibacter sitiensis]|uniref:TatD family hydrolase n=1 Tax=Olivibacter sitiensis TaxID=376470 RepID=UPI00040DE36A|nr:TatD family hydrolase [Olivibacter sitiensis]
MFEFSEKPFYIDVHTHRANSSEDLIAIYNVASNYLNPLAQQRHLYFSMGIHPWFVQADLWEQDIKAMGRAAQQEEVLAIGECGLDKVCDTEWHFQEEVFIRQIQLAKKLGKPLIIHCVKAHHEVLKILEEQSFSTSVIFHGFNKKWELAKQILDKGYYLSYGTSILHANKSESLSKTPSAQLFLESDDKEIDIRNIYQAASAIRKEKLITTQETIQENFARLFNN